VTALDGAGLEAKRGRILGFLGPNGAGKTTAMRSIFALVALDSGGVTWDDEKVTPAMRRRFGYMPEQRGLYPKMKARRQIAWLGRIRGMEAGEADRAAMSWLERLGLGDRAEDRIEQLSHGNQQRAQLAASLVHEPDLLVLDEPFSGLDPMGVDSMSRIIRERADAGAAVVFSSHQLDLVEDVCDDVAIIDRGRIVVTGTIDEVRSGAPLRRVEAGFVDQRVAWSPDGEAIPVAGRPGLVVFLVPRDRDPSDLLASARKVGRLRSFSFEPPRLSDVFRSAVRR
jgi:ABC-2 type transport system ATP-binding protein